MIALINYMAGFFKKKHQKRPHQARLDKADVKPSRPKTSDKDLVDPISYVGDLDNTKYPYLALGKKEEQEFDVENPLNKR